MKKMKKMILSLAIVAIAAVATLNVNFNSKNNSDELSLLGLANVEALAGELPEFVLDCTGGKCERSGSSLCMSGEHTCFRCEYTGDPKDFCPCPC